ncbi:Hexosyltransferase [Aphelenchoides besseyi]|nr:Hexosyltransferase [Aphelenchoides besseyi]
MSWLLKRRFSEILQSEVGQYFCQIGNLVRLKQKPLIAVLVLITIGVIVLIDKQWVSYNQEALRLSKSINSSHCQDIAQPLLPREMFGDAMQQPKIDVCVNVSFLVIVISRPEDFYAREMIRKTWMKETVKQTLGLSSPVFLVGRRSDQELNSLLDEEQQQYGDVIRYTVDDTYKLLYVKVHAAFSWQQQFCPHVRYLLKTDDDTVVDLNRLDHYVRTEFNPLLVEHPKSFFCNRWKGHKPFRDPNNRWFVSSKEYNRTVFPTFCQGCSYLLSTAAVASLLNNTATVKSIHLEDVLYTGLVAEKTPNVYHHNSAAFGAKREGKCDQHKVPYLCAYIGVSAWKLQFDYKKMKNLNCS